MHVVSAVVWIGGLIFINTVLNPIAEHEGSTRSAPVLGSQRRFFPFVWSSLWTLLITGALLMLFSPKFIWFDYSTLWSKLLAIKQVAFLLSAFFSWQMLKVFQQMEAHSGDAEAFEGWRLGFQKLLRRSIAFGLVGLMCASGMAFG